MDIRHAYERTQQRNPTKSAFRAKKSPQSRKCHHSVRPSAPTTARNPALRSIRKSEVSPGCGGLGKQGIKGTPSTSPTNNYRSDVDLSNAELDRLIHDKAKNRKLKNYLLYALADRPDMERYANKLRSCKCGVRLVGGVPKVQRFSCDLRHCPDCFAARQTKQRAILKRTFAKAADYLHNHNEDAKTNEDKDTLYAHFITYTLDSSKDEVPLGTRERVRFFRDRQNHFRRSRWFKKNVVGSFMRMEATWRDCADYIHIHGHMVVLSKLNFRDFSIQAERKWGLGFATTKKWHLDKMYLEMTKGDISASDSKDRLVDYLHKPFSLDIAPDKLVETIDAFNHERIRTTSATGLLRIWKKESSIANDLDQEEDKREIEMPTPPKGVKSLPDGFYSRLDLLYKARQGNQYAVFCLKYLHWWKNKKGQMSQEEAAWWKIWSPNAPR